MEGKFPGGVLQRGDDTPRTPRFAPSLWSSVRTLVPRAEAQRQGEETGQNRVAGPGSSVRAFLPGAACVPLAGVSPGPVALGRLHGSEADRWPPCLHQEME